MSSRNIFDNRIASICLGDIHFKILVFYVMEQFLKQRRQKRNGGGVKKEKSRIGKFVKKITIVAGLENLLVERKWNYGFQCYRYYS